MKRLLAVFAHPDDESVFAGVLAHYARLGVEVSLICATKGEAGEISDPILATPANLGARRTAELECACDIIGVRQLHFLDYCDSGMEGTLENQSPTAFINADSEQVLGKLVALLRAIKPDILLTFEPQGWYGHPDHIATSRYVTEAYLQAGDPQAFPGTGPAWQSKRLFYTAFLRDQFKIFVDYARQAGIDLDDLSELDLDQPDPLASRITHVLDILPLIDLKLSAFRCHKTQFGQDNLFMSVPAEVFAQALGEEHFIQVDPPQVPGELPSHDLFASLPE